MNTSTLFAFLFASIVLAVTPGPGVIYIVTRTLAQGRIAGASSVAGVACGNMLNAVGAALGLAALFALSSLAFTVVKFAGAAYLIWMGVKMLRAGAGSTATSAAASPGVAQVRASRVFRDGVLVALLNPKTTIFFAAFLPQFMQADAPALPQALLLGAIFVVVAASSDLVYVTLASWL
ncbi:MAG TPA: LysE family translocator, partial [Burkholderiaceae bacterium]|nr:LysE family translocator [Burkholderiaceae bacterium]